MATTYDKIATTTLSSATNTITFSSIAATYTDLRLVLTHTTTLAGRSAYLQFNSDTGANYSFTTLQGNGTAAASQNNTAENQIYIDDFTMDGTSTTIPNFSAIDIFSYASSTFKTLLCSVSANHNTTGGLINIVGLWRSTSAITAISLITNSSTFKVGTSATLYGIKAA
jgi:hypothetical protein